MLREVKVSNFKYGLIDSLESRSIPRGALSSNKNWTSKADKLELRLGMRLIGSQVTGNGRITGLAVGNNADGSVVLFDSYGKKVKYYDAVSETWSEIGTDILGAKADGEDISFSQYASLAGYQMWLSSPNSSLIKIMIANPASYTDMYADGKNYKGYISIIQSRMTLWGRIKDKTAVYKSYIDSLTTTAVTAEAYGTGNGVLVTFTHTAAFKAGDAKRTGYAFTVTDGVETFADNYNGTLTGSAGGTGTVNYTTGAMSVTFNAPPANLAAITCGYNWENSNAGGISDFSASTPRQAGQGVSFRQDDGGYPLMSVLAFENAEYCMHTGKTWSLVLTNDDSNAENTIYRDRVGIPNWRAAFSAGEGVYYIDVTDNGNPSFNILRYGQQNAKLEPIDISINLDLTGYAFDRGVVYKIGKDIYFEGRTLASTYNNTTFVYDTSLSLWNKYDFVVSCFAEYSGTLYAGDDISNNVYELMSGFDDDDAIIDGECIMNSDILDTQELKKVKQLIVMGEIDPEQNIEVYAQTDGGDFVKIGDISGSGDYVDSNSKVYVGSSKIGSSTIGGASTEITSQTYIRKFKLSLDKFYEIRLKFKNTGLGYASITSVAYRDIRLKSQKIPKKYRTSSNK